MQKVTPFLWFDDNAEEAIHFYVSLFENSRVTGERRKEPGGPLFTATFVLDGQEFMALNGGPAHKLTEGFSLFVSCASQAEVDELWEKLRRGGSELRCGWVRDRFGLTWQIIPTALGELLGDPDPAKAARVMEAMLRMTKIDVEELRRAHAGS